ncbi:MAG TPA: hypothetical protein VGN86_04730 [Pyrinomonadaceae bacterium]|jgi:hypothetical protein|nr:hypothetical protein [Pyrinomonadaceae bacterium]
MKSKHNGNGHGHVTETPDVSHIRNLDVTHETGDVYVRGIVTFLLGLSAMTVIVYLLMWGMFRILYAQEEARDDSPSPMAMSSQERLPPEPRLQSAPGFAADLAKEGEKKAEGHPGEVENSGKPRDPLFEIKVLREHWKMTLESGEKDPSGKVIVRPIEEAKKELLNKGLPVRNQ